jgi:CRISPR system Cascade subunit CasC
VVDWAKLADNLQGDTELAAKGLRTFLEGFVMAEPTGKQNTFAAHNPPEFVAVTVCHDAAPRNPPTRSRRRYAPRPANR